MCMHIYTLRAQKYGSDSGYVYTGPAEYLVGHILGQLSSRPKKKSLRHCVYTGPVCQVHDMRNASDLLQAKVLPRNQSDRSANVTNWPVNGKDVKESIF